MDKKAKNILRYTFWIAVAVILVYFCLRSIDWGQFAEALRQCRWGYVLLSMGLGALVFLFRGIRWQMLLKPIDPSTSWVSSFNAYNICMAANLVVPRAGEVARLGYVVKHSAMDTEGKRLLSFDKALGTVLIERVWDIVIMACMCAILIIVKWEDFGAYLMENLSGISGSTVLWLIVGSLVVLIGGLLALSYAFRNKNDAWGKIWRFIVGIGKGLASFKYMKNGWLFLCYTALIWGFYWLTSACIVWALQDIEAFANLTLIDAFFLMIAGSVSAIVPVPGGFGAYHGVVAGALLSIWGIPLGTGMIYATLNHESQTLVHAFLGLGSYIHESFFRKK